MSLTAQHNLHWYYCLSLRKTKKTKKKPEHDEARCQQDMHSQPSVQGLLPPFSTPTILIPARQHSTAFLTNSAIPTQGFDPYVPSASLIVVYTRAPSIEELVSFDVSTLRGLYEFESRPLLWQPVNHLYVGRQTPFPQSP